MIFTNPEHVTLVARSCHYHAQAIRHIRHKFTVNGAGIDTGAQPDTDEAVYCNSLLTAHIPAISRHYSACRTTPLGLFCKLRGGATQTCKPAAAPAPLAAGSSQNQLQAGCDDLQDHSTGLPAFLSHHVNPRETTRTLRSYDILLLTVSFTRTELASREACLPMRSSICLELTTFIHHQQRLSGDLQISAENLLFPVIVRLLWTRLTSSHSRQRL